MFGHIPKIDWSDNADGAIRSISEAVAIAKAHGVEVPDEVADRSVVQMRRNDHDS